MTRIRRRLIFVVTAVAVLCTTSASAQVFGTFAWQMQPYCNVVTLTITQFAAGYTVDGSDNQCGAGTLAGATGQVTINPDGTVGVAFAIVTSPSGKAVHVSAVLSPANGSGTWTDSVGNSGTFALGANTGGSARPLPTSGVAAASITNVEIANNTITGANVADGTLASADLLDGPRAVGTTADNVPLTSGAVTVASVTLVAPGPGKILVHATGTHAGSPYGTSRRYNCGLTTGTSLPPIPDKVYVDYSELQGPFAATNTISVPSAGSTTIRLVCTQFIGSTILYGVHMDAIYVRQ